MRYNKIRVFADSEKRGFFDEKDIRMLAALMALRTAAGTVSCGGSGIITEGYLVDLNTIPR